MSQVSQKQAVVNAVAEVLGNDFTSGTTVVKNIITKEQKAAVRDLVFNGITNGTTLYAKSTTDTKEVQKYVNSMVDNHIRKAKELNGSESYKAKATGVRRDPQLKELSKLLQRFPEGTPEFAQIVEHIEQRNLQLDDIRTQKRTSSNIGPINTDVLPAHLRDLVNSTSV